MFPFSNFRLRNLMAAGSDSRADSCFAQACFKKCAARGGMSSGEHTSKGCQCSLPVSLVANRASLAKDCDVDLNKFFRATGPLALAWFQLAGFSAAAADVKAEALARFSDYRLVDSELKVVGIDSDPTESFLAMQLDG